MLDTTPVTLTMTLAELDRLRNLERQIDDLINRDLAYMTTRADNLQKAVDLLQSDIASRDAKIKDLESVNAVQAQELAAALKRIAELEPVPDVVVVPPETKPQPDVFPFAGAYFEDPRPDDSVNDQREALFHAEALRPLLTYTRANSDLLDVITFCNIEDLKLGELPRLIRDLRFRWWQSPVQSLYRVGQPDQAPFIDHLRRLKDAGVYGLFIDDAQNIPANDMPRLIDLINQYVPDAPVVCSFAAYFDDREYPKQRYVDSRQWFTGEREKEADWFPRWKKGPGVQIYTADVWRRGNGYMHSPERVQAAFDIALPLVQGIAWYSMCNKTWNHVTDHQAAKAKNKDTLTMFDVIAGCTAKYLKRS